ncbi:oxaloacetate decarboxylase [Pseudooceanicola sp.]|uniref:isocitrate lyase/PEP mutase family protein n=1 Tax=Pseudooceanicola sp. TaxID=1914328 RepID=UPI0035192A33
MATDQQDKYERFKALHQRAGAFVMPNAWDAGTARILTAMGFEALATSSAGFAYAVGKRDSRAVLTRTEVLENARAIAEATTLPVSADLEDGFGIMPETCAETVTLAAECGLVGGSIEDATGHADAPIYEMQLAEERIAAAVEAVRDKPFLVTARAENFLWHRHDLDDTIHRLQAYAAAGADVLYVPGLSDLRDIRTICEALDRPISVSMATVTPSFSVEELGAAGVKRISVGSSFARAALGAMMRAAEEVLEQGTFTYAKSAASGATLAEMMRADKPGART